MDLKKYGFVPDMMPENAQGIPARITAVFKERYALVCEYGEIYGKLKTKEYFGGFEEFPTTGDFVLINYNLSGDSQIIKFLLCFYHAVIEPGFQCQAPGTIPDFGMAIGSYSSCGTDKSRSCG